MGHHRLALRRSNIVRFHLGPLKVYLVNSARHVQAMFRPSAGISSDIFLLMVQEHIWGSTKEDLAKFAGDKSGRLRVPAPGTEDTPERERYWATMHRITHEYLARTRETDVLAASYQRFFAQRLNERFPPGADTGEGTVARIFDLMLTDMAGAAVLAFNGARLLERTPDLLDRLWRFDEVAASLVWGLPRWLIPKASRRRERFNAAIANHLAAAIDEFDWTSPDDPDWEPVFGSRFTRELVRWMRDADFAPQTMAGAITNMTVFG